MNTRKLSSVSDITLVICVGVLVAHVGTTSAQTVRRGEVRMALDSFDGLEIKAMSEKGGDAVKVKADIATYKGRRALHMLNDDTTMTARTASGGESLAVVKSSDFKDGTIEVDVVGMPRRGANSETEASSESHFIFKGMSKSLRISICVLPTDVPMTSFAAITLRSTLHSRIFPGTASGRRTPEFTSPMWISKKTPGRT